MHLTIDLLKAADSIDQFGRSRQEHGVGQVVLAGTDAMDEHVLRRAGIRVARGCHTRGK